MGEWSCMAAASVSQIHGSECQAVRQTPLPGPYWGMCDADHHAAALDE